VIPTAYGYLDVPSSNGNGDIELAEEPVTTEQEDDRTKIGKKERVERRYFVGDQGVGIWREGMEVGNMMRDGVGTSFSTAQKPFRKLNHFVCTARFSNVQSRIPRRSLISCIMPFIHR
jgi:hypothetical protein